MIMYNIKRFIHCFNSWEYWLLIDYEKLENESKPYNPRSIYWSYNEKGKTVATNFWWVINEGYYEMIEEFYGTY